jgi:Icc-related predicted phosphoesterase
MNIRSCDVLVHCGDACTKGNLSEALDFLYWYVKQNAKYKIIVPGNHDLKLRTHPDAIKLAKDMGIIVLNNDYINIEGINIYGVSKTFKGMNDPRFQGKEWGSIEDRTDAWKDIPDNLDILVTHMPPNKILDYVPDKNQNIGCPMLLEKVKESKPRFHIFGHVHECAGQSVVTPDTVFLNVACKNRQYVLIKDFYELNLR